MTDHQALAILVCGLGGWVIGSILGHLIFWAAITIRDRRRAKKWNSYWNER